MLDSWHGCPSSTHLAHVTRFHFHIVERWKHSMIESMAPTRQAAELDHSRNDAEIEKTVRSVSVVTSWLQREFMRLIPKRRRCKNFPPPTLSEGRVRKRGRGSRGECRRCLKMRVPRRRLCPHSCIRVMLRAALLIVLRPLYSPDRHSLLSRAPVRCMIKKFLPIPLFSLDERGGRRLRSGASDIFFDKKYPRPPEIVAGEGVTRRLIDAPPAPQSQLFYENGIPRRRRRRPQVINPSNTPRPPSSVPTEPLAPARKRLPVAGGAEAAADGPPRHPARAARHHLRARPHRRLHRGHRHPRRQDQDALEGDQGRRRRKPHRRGEGPLRVLVGTEGAAQTSHEDDDVSSQYIFNRGKTKNTLTHSLPSLCQGAGRRRSDWGWSIPLWTTPLGCGRILWRNRGSDRGRRCITPAAAAAGAGKRTRGRERCRRRAAAQLGPPSPRMIQFTR